MDVRSGLAEIAALLQRHAFTFADERELQEGIAAVLAPLGPAREVRVGARDRIDFLLPGGIGVEVKIDGSLSALTRQAHRYAQRAEIAALIIVTNRHRLAQLPDTISGKPVRVVTVGGW
jgi:hypothetical protein